MLRRLGDICTVFVVFPLLVASYSLLMAIERISTPWAKRIESAMCLLFVSLTAGSQGVD